MSKNSIKLTKEQREELEQLISKGTARARKIQHAHVLLKIDSGEGGANWSDCKCWESVGENSTIMWAAKRA
jgi:hypothetical protein